MNGKFTKGCYPFEHWMFDLSTKIWYDELIILCIMTIYHVFRFCFVYLKMMYK